MTRVESFQKCVCVLFLTSLLIAGAGSALCNTTGQLIFTDPSWLEIAIGYPAGSTAAYVQLTDPDLNTNSGVRERHVLIMTTTQGDTEYLSVRETSGSSGVFRGFMPLDEEMLKAYLGIEDKLPDGDSPEAASARREMIEKAIADLKGKSLRDGIEIGDGVLQVVLDDTIQVRYEDAANDLGQPDVIEANAIYGYSELPDFKPIQIFAPAEITIDTPFEITWRVRNFGPVEAIGTWADGIYVGETTVENLIAEFPVTGPLEPDSSYVFTQTITIPDNYPDGWYNLIVLVDHYNIIDEADDTSADNRLAELVYLSHTGAPFGPSNLRITSPSDTQLHLTWQDNSTNETAFQISRGLTSGSVAPIDTVGANNASFTDSGLMPGTMYHYCVHAFNEHGLSSESACDSAMTCDPPDVDAGPDAQLTCAVTQIVLNGSSSTTGAIFSWSTVDGNIVSGADMPNPVVDQPGIYTLYVTDPVSDCTGRDDAVVTQDITPPDVDAGPDQIITSVAPQTTLQGSSTTPGASFSWTTADGHIVSGTDTANPVVDQAGTYTLTVTGPANGCTASDAAVVTFVDIPAVAFLEQLKNGSAFAPEDTVRWTENSADADSAHYAEGQSIAYRLVMNGLPAGVPVEVVLEYDIKQLTRQAIDYLTGYQRLAHEHLQIFGHPAENVDPTIDIPGVSGLPTSMYGIPAPGSVNSPVPGMPTSSFNALPADERAMSLWNGTITDIAYVSEGDLTNPYQAASRIRVTFTADQSTAVLAWGGHIADVAEWDRDAESEPWSATHVGGFPYSMRLVGWNLNSFPAQARSVAADAVYGVGPVCHVTPQYLQICAGETAVFTDHTPLGYPPYVWNWPGPDPDGPPLSTEPTLTITNATPADAGTYTVSVWDGEDFQASCDVILDVIPAPDVDAGPDTQLTCAVTEVTLNGSSGTAGVTYSWTTLGGNIVSGADTPSPVVDQPASYALTVTDPVNGCTASDTVYVTQDIAPPSADAGPDKILSGLNPQVTLTGSSTTLGVTFSWTTTDGNIVSGAETATPIVNQPGTYTLTVTNPINGCAATDDVEVTQEPYPPCGTQDIVALVLESGDINGDLVPFTPMTADLVLMNCSAQGQAITGWETRIEGTSNIFITEAVPYGDHINVGQSPDYAVGLSSPLYADADGWIRLMRITFMVSDTQPAEFTLNVVSNPSIPGCAAYAAIDLSTQCMTPISGSYGSPAVSINGDDLPYSLARCGLLTWSDAAGFDGQDGVNPNAGDHSVTFEFRVVYHNASNLPPVAGDPMLHIDANGDGDTFDLAEGSYSMVPVDDDTTYTDGREYHLLMNLSESGNSYFYRFSATGASGMVAVGDPTRWTDDLYVESLPVGPSDLVSFGITATSISLTWTNHATNADSFVVHRKEGVAGTYEHVGSTPPSTTWYNDAGLTPGTTYYYKVYAKNGAGLSIASADSHFTTLPLQDLPECSDQDVIAVFFENDDINMTAPLGVPVAASLVLMNPSTSSGCIKSWQAQIAMPAGAVMVNMDLLGGINSAASPAFDIQYPEPLCPNPAGHVTLMKMSIITFASPAEIFLEPYAGADIAGCIDYADAADPGTYRCLTPISGAHDEPVAAINGDVLPYCPSWTPHLNWSSAAGFDDLDGVDPESGSPGTVFQFRIVYADPHDVPPGTGHPVLHLDANGDGDTDDSSDTTMVMVPVAPDDNYVDGREYMCELALDQVGDTYQHAFTALNQDGQGALGQPTRWTAGPQVGTLPASPTDLTATSASPGRIDLSWTDNSDNESGFRIYRGLDAASGSTLIATVGPDTVSFADSGLVPLTTYHYCVYAYNTLGESSACASDSATTLEPPLPLQCSDTNQLAILFADDSNHLISDPSLITASLVLINPSLTSGCLHGWDARIEYPDNLWPTAWSPQGAYTNSASPPEFSIQLSQPLCPDHRGYIELMQMQFLVSNATPADLFIHPLPASGSGCPVLYDGLSQVCATSVSGSEYLPAARINGTALPYDPLDCTRLLWSLDAGFDGQDGVNPNIELVDNTFQFRVVYRNGENLYPIAGHPLLHLDVNGDGDIDDPGEGSFAMAALDTSTNLAAGKQYVLDLPLSLVGADYQYMFSAINTSAATALGPPTSWKDGLTVVGPPAAPSNLQANTVSDSRIDLSWQDNSNDETGFRIYRGASSDSVNSLLATRPANTTSYSDTELVHGTTYHYCVESFHDYAVSTTTTCDSATTIALPPDVSAGPDKQLTCAVPVDTLEGSSSTPGVTYAWTTLNGHIVSGADTPHAVVDQSGTYTLTVTDPRVGLSSDDNVLVTEDFTLPHVDAGPDMVIGPSNPQVMLMGVSFTPGVSYHWTTVGGHIVSGENTPNPIVDQPGSYTLTVTKPTNGCSASDIAAVSEEGGTQCGESDVIAIVFENGDVNYDLPVMTPSTANLVILNPSAPDDCVSGWEAYITVPPGVFVTQWRPLGQYVNVGSAPEFAVGLTAGELCADINAMVTLMSFDFLTTTTDPADFAIDLVTHPSGVDTSGNPCNGYVSPSDLGNVICLTPISGEYGLTVARLNGPDLPHGLADCTKLTWSQYPGYEGQDGVNPDAVAPGDTVQFQVTYQSAYNAPPAAGLPQMELDINGDGDATDAGEGTYTLTALEPDDYYVNGREYYLRLSLSQISYDYQYRFSAVDTAGREATGLPTVWTGGLVCDERPASPTNLQATGITETSIALAWDDNSSNETNFLIERKLTDGGGDFAVIDTVGANVTTYLDDGLIPITHYTYRIFALNIVGRSVDYAEDTFETGGSYPHPDCVDPDQMAIVFDNGSCNFDPTVPGETYSAWLVLINPDSPSGAIEGFEVKLEFPTTLSFLPTNFVLPPGAVNSATQPEFAVQLADPVYPDSTGHVRLMEIKFTALEFSPVDLHLRPVAVPTLPGCASIDYAPGDPHCAALISGSEDRPVARLNGPSLLHDPFNCSRYLWSVAAGYEGRDGVHPNGVEPGDSVQFRVVYRNGEGMPLEAGYPILHLDANGDGDDQDPGDGIYVMSPVDGSTDFAAGKEYSHGMALTEIGSDYQYRFSGADTSGSVVSGPPTRWTGDLAVGSLPEAPTFFEALSPNFQQINIGWVDNSDNEDGFRIYRGLASDAVDSLLAELGPNATTYQDTGLSAGTTYHYCVAAFNAVGESASRACGSENTTPQPPPADCQTPYQMAIIFDNGSSNIDHDSGPLTATLVMINTATNARGITAFDVQLGYALPPGASITGYTLPAGATNSATAPQFAVTFADPLLPSSSGYVELLQIHLDVSSPLQVDLYLQPFSNPDCPLFWLDGLDESCATIVSGHKLLPVARVNGPALAYDPLLCARLLWSLAAGFDGQDGVDPDLADPGQTFQFRVVYRNSENIPPQVWDPTLFLDINGDGDILDPGEGSFTMTALDTSTNYAAGKEYYHDIALTQMGRDYAYRFEAESETGDFALGPPVEWTAGPDVGSLPVAPTDLVITPETPRELHLQWVDNATFEDGFHVYRGLAPDAIDELVVTLDPDSTEYADDKLEPSTIYYYCIKSFNFHGESDVCAYGNATTPAAPPAPDCSDPDQVAIVFDSGASTIDHTDGPLTATLVLINPSSPIGTIDRFTCSLEIEQPAGFSITGYTYPPGTTNAAAEPDFDLNYAQPLSPGPSGHIELMQIHFDVNTTAQVDMYAVPVGGDPGCLTIQHDQVSPSYCGTPISGSSYLPVARLNGDAFDYDSIRCSRLLYSAYSGYDGTDGVNPNFGAVGDTFQFRVVYRNGLSIPPNAGDPMLHLDINGDGDIEDPDEGTFTMSPLPGSPSIEYGKEYYYDAELNHRGSDYKYRFSATDQNGDDALGPPNKWLGSLVVQELPASPTNLAATPTSFHGIDLTWDDNSDNETGFKIYRGLSADNITTLIGTVGVDSMSYQDDWLQPSATYFYRVYAYNGLGLSEAPAETSATTLDAPPPPGCADPDLITLFFDNGDVNLDLAPFTPVTATLAIQNPSTPSGCTLGWEAMLQFSSNIAVTQTEILGQNLNVGTFPEFRVGLASALCADSNGLINVLSITFQVTDSQPAEFYLLAPENEPAPDCIDYIGSDDPMSTLCLTPISGSSFLPVARINGPDLPWCSPIGDVDLEPISVTAPPDALMGRRLGLSFTVRNNGPDTVSGTYYDRIYLSTDAVLDQNDQELKEIERSDDTPAGTTYTVTDSVMVPPMPPGDYWFLLEVDAQDLILEADAEDNNWLAAGNPTTLLIPPRPDLRASNILVPAIALPNEQVEITYTVTNHGDAAASTSWKDFIYLSYDGQIGGDEYLGSFTYTGGLQADSSYTHIHTITIPAHASGIRWIVVFTDAENDVMEFDGEGNNTAISANSFPIPPPSYPDLIVESVSAPDSVDAGQEMAISWTVRNTGDGPTNAPLWEDYIYLSPDSTLSPGDYFLRSTYNPTYLAPGNHYNMNANVSIPSQIAGYYYVIVKTDARNAVDEHLNEHNNVNWSEPPTYVRYRSALLDVVYIQPQDPPYWSGEYVELTWAVENIGDAPFNSTEWDDGIALSADPVLADDDTLLASGFMHFTPLAAGETDTVTYSVRLPVDYSGGYHLFVIPNIGDVNVPGIARSDSIDVILSPSPNLTVTDITTQIYVDSGDPLPLGWTVKNIGGGVTNVLSWKDAVYISADDQLDVQTDLLLAEYPVTEYLPPNQQYTQSHDVPIPSGIWGNYYLFVCTDSRNDVFEGDFEHDNCLISDQVTISLTPPDLQVMMIAPLDTPASGQELRIDWRVRNFGTGTTSPDSWTDRFYLSIDDALDTGEDFEIASHRHEGALPPGVSYRDTVVAHLPESTIGPFHLFVYTDADDEIVEHLAEANNDTSISISIELTPPPDLQVTSLALPPIAQSGQEIGLAWQVANLGLGDIGEAAWKDAVFISEDTLLVIGEDVFLGFFDATGPLAVEETYELAPTIHLPNGLDGQYHIFVWADYQNVIFEHLNEDNNTRHEPLAIVLTDPPDFQVTHFSVQPELIGGDPAGMQWVVENLGPGATPPGSSWSDAIYLSDTDTLQSKLKVLLGSFDHSGGEADDGYLMDEDLTIPAGYYGDFYLICVTDDQNSVYEHVLEDNNSRSVAVHIVEPPPRLPDLQPLSLSAPETIGTKRAGTVPVQWSVKNVGSYAPSPVQSYWRDALYLSQDELLDVNNDLMLYASNHTGGLAPDSSYAASADIQFPMGYEGSYHLLLRTDDLNRVTEDSEQNNIMTVPVALEIQPVDLVPTIVDYPDSLISGQFIQIHWAVSNNGAAGTKSGSWYDSIHLSRDLIMDSTDHLLSSVYHSGDLLSGESYQDSLTALVPLGMSGYFYVFVQTDKNNAVYEHAAEDNNITHSVDPVRIILAEPADLVVGSIDPPVSAEVGQLFNVTWEVSNIGGNDAPGYWLDAVYVSTDQQWDLNDVHLGSVPHVGGLPAGQRYKGSYSGNLSTDLPGVANGDYYVIVRTDIRNNVFEGDSESNNTAASDDSMAVTVLELALDEQHDDAVGPGHSMYYHVSAGQANDLKLAVQADHDYDQLILYVRYGDVPSRIDFDYSFEVAPDVQAVVPGGGSDGVYVMIYGYYISGAGQFRITPTAIQFQISQASPVRVGNAGFATIHLTGGQLLEVIGATLTSEAKTVVESWSVDPLNTAQVDANFDLRGVAPDLYDIYVVTSSQDTSQLLLDEIEVIPGNDAIITPSIQGPTTVRLGYSADYRFVLENTGSSDAYDVVCLVSLSPGVEYRFIGASQESGRQVADGGQIAFASDYIPVGGEEQFVLRLWPPAQASIEIVAVYSSADLVTVPAPDLAGSGPDDGKRQSPNTGILTTYALEAMDAYLDELAALSHAIDRENFEPIWSSAWFGSRTSEATEYLRERIREVSALALGELADPSLPPDHPDVDQAVAAAAAALQQIVAAAGAGGGWLHADHIISTVIAWDPNEKHGLDGTGNAFFAAGDRVPYTLYFENLPNANAPARYVEVRDRLDESFDLSQLRLSEITFANTVITVPPDLQRYETIINLDSGLQLHIDAGIDTQLREARWIFNTIDPATGQPPTDQQLGFLAPNDTTTHVGEGHVTFTIKSYPHLLEGTQIPNGSEIVFDTNDPILTNVVNATINRAWSDLRCSSIRPEAVRMPPMEGEEVVINATIENIGAIAAADIMVSIYRGNRITGTIIEDSIPIPSLAAGMSAEVMATWPLNYIAGQETIMVYVDPDSLIDEASEENNKRTVILPVSPRSFSIHPVHGLNVIAMPLVPLPPYDAASFAQYLTASFVVRIASDGSFETYSSSDPLAEPFPIEAGQGYICFLELPGYRMTFQGITAPGELAVSEGLNLLGLPLDPGTPMTAREFAQRLNARMLLRYDPLDNRFKAFLPDFHVGDGYLIDGGVGYVVSSDRDTTATFTGTGWLGEQGGQFKTASSKTGDEKQKTSTAVFAYYGTVSVGQRGRDTGTPLGEKANLVLTNLQTGAESVTKLQPENGHFSGAFVDFSNNQPTSAGDFILLHVEKPNGEKIGELEGFTVSQDAAAHATIDLGRLVLHSVPVRTRVEAGFPNPFNPVTTIRYQLAKPGKVTMKIYDVRGRLVKTLVDRKLEPGYYEETWKSEDNRGRRVASGIYLCRFSAPGYEHSHKLVLVK